MIKIYACDLIATEPKIQTVKRLLSRDELARASGFRVTDAHNNFVLCRTALRLILADHLGTQPGSLRFAYGISGKPYLAYPETRLLFNVSHSGTKALIGIADDGDIGVDLEEVRYSSGLPDVAERVFTEDELLYLHELRPADWLTGFYTLWTLKEAYVKALGCGMNVDLRSIQVDTSSGEPPRLESDDDRSWARSIVLAPGYAAAVAGLNKPCDWRLYSYDF